MWHPGICTYLHRTIPTYINIFVQVFKKLGDAGLLGVNKPEEFGGMGLDFKVGPTGCSIYWVQIHINPLHNNWTEFMGQFVWLEAKTKVFNQIFFPFNEKFDNSEKPYYMSRKLWPILYSNLLYKLGHYFLGTQYVEIFVYKPDIETWPDVHLPYRQ